MLRFLTAGESHGQALSAIVESFPAGISLSKEEIDYQLERRQKGFGRGKRMRIEKDKVKIIAGLRNGKTLGSPIICLIENRDWPNWKKINNPVKPIGRRLSERERKLAYNVTAPRPGHADLAGAIKYHTYDLRNVLERASARETAARVACGTIARQLLQKFQIRIAAHVIAIGRVRLRKKNISFEAIESYAEKSPVRCIEKNISHKMVDEIKTAIAEKDTLGGIFEVRANNVPIGLGENSQWYKRLDAALAEAVMSIPSVKGVEIGNAFQNTRKFGSQVHDPIGYQATAAGPAHGFRRKSNNAGGIEGGLSNGAEIIIRAACKPVSTLRQPLDTIDIVSKMSAKALVERSDTCVVPAAAVVGEAMVAMVLASAFTDKFGGDSLTEINENYEAYLRREF